MLNKERKRLGVGIVLSVKVRIVSIIREYSVVKGKVYKDIIGFVYLDVIGIF